MRKFALLILPLLFAVPNTAHAFKWSKCKAVYKPWARSSPTSKVFGEQLMQISAEITSEKTSQSSSSTTSYVSSTGHCKAFAKAEEDRNKFIASSITELKMEAAEGRGEHVESLAVLYGCPANVQPKFFDMMKSNHADIFPVNPPDDSGSVTKRITDRLIQQEALRDNCNLGLI